MGPTSKGRGEEGGEGEGMGGEARGGEGKEEGRRGDPTPSRPPNPYFWIRF